MSGFRDWFTNQRRQVSRMGKLSNINLSGRKKEKKAKRGLEQRRDDFVVIDLGGAGAVCKKCFLINGLIPPSKTTFLTQEEVNHQARTFICNDCGRKIPYKKAAPSGEL